MNIDNDYQNLIKYILNYGDEIQTRNSKVLRTTNYCIKVESTPLISLRKTAWKTSLKEMQWWLSGSADLKEADQTVQKWWKPWADSNDRVNNSYSHQFRDFKGNSEDNDGIDQISYLINNIKKDPFSRRHMITCWNTYDMTLTQTKLPNCHSSLIQATVQVNNTIDFGVWQRSADVMLGLPHNLIQHYALYTYIANKAGYNLGKIVYIMGDLHIYEDHLQIAKKLSEVDLVNIQTPQLAYSPTNGEFLASDFILDSEYVPINNDKLRMIV